jgi:hypothetical protein
MPERNQLRERKINFGYGFRGFSLWSCSVVSGPVVREGNTCWSKAALLMVAKGQNKMGRPQGQNVPFKGTTTSN